MKLDIKKQKFEIYIECKNKDAEMFIKKVKKYFPCHDRKIYDCREILGSKRETTKLRKKLIVMGAPEDFKFPIALKNGIYYNIGAIPENEFIIINHDLYDIIE